MSVISWGEGFVNAIFSSILESHEALQLRLANSAAFAAEVRKKLTAAQIRSKRFENVCIFAAGSLGRYETGSRSDLDVFLVADKESRDPKTKSVSNLREIEILAELIRVNDELVLPEFSGDGRFLKIHELDDIVDATGDSSRDDSENLFTTRLLLLLESKSLFNDRLYKFAIERVVRNYYRDGTDRNDFKPLFLLNDLLRYWRTLCLNYERDRTLERPWWKRNLNLKFSRKMTVFSTVLAIVAGRVDEPFEFIRLTSEVPLRRLALTLDFLGDATLVNGFTRALDSYESFLAAKANKDVDSVVGEELRSKAGEFGRFFDQAIRSEKLDPAVVRYVCI